MSNTNIYVLRLEGGKFYVGKSKNVMKRYAEHLKGQGSAWTRLYKPISVERIIENASPFDEDKITKECMAKYGIDRVRGGSYVEIDLSDFHLEALKMEIWSAKNLCTTCGRQGHFAKDCYASKDASGNSIVSDDSSEEEEEYVWGCEYCEKEFYSELDCENHEEKCYRKHSKSDSCYRCGREGHYASDCYASKHIEGYRLY